MMWCIRKDIPFNAVCDKEFREITKDFVGIPTRRTYTDTYVEVLVKAVMKSFKEDIHNLSVSNFALSIDSWTGDYRHNSYTAILLHYLDKSFKYQVVSIAYKNLVNIFT